MVLALSCECGSLDPQVGYVLACSVCGEHAEVDVKKEFTQGIENRDPRKIRRAVGAVGLGLGMRSDQLEIAWHLLEIDGRRGLLDQIEDMRSTISSLGETVVKAEERAQALEKQFMNGLFLSCEAARDGSLDIRQAIERRLHDNLERRVEQAIQVAVARSSQLLLASATKVVQLQRELQAAPIPVAFTPNEREQVQMPSALASMGSTTQKTNGRMPCVSIHSHEKNGDLIEDAIKQQFHDMDVDGDGQISKMEMAKFFSDTISQEDVDYMFQLLDKNRDGHLDFDEFVQWVMQCSGTAAVRDPNQNIVNSGGPWR